MHAEHTSKVSSENTAWIRTNNALKITAQSKEKAPFLLPSVRKTNIYLLNHLRSEFHPDVELILQSPPLSQKIQGKLRVFECNGEILSGRIIISSEAQGYLIAFEKAELGASLQQLIEKTVHAPQHSSGVSTYLTYSTQIQVILNQDCQVIAFSDEARKTSSKLKGKPLQTSDSLLPYLPKDQTEAFKTNTINAINGQESRNRIELEDLEGNKHWLSCTLGSLTYQKQTFALLTIQDITHQKQLQEELIFQKNFVQNIIQSSGLNFFLLNENFCITRINKGFSDLSGYLSSELIGKPISQLVEHKEDQSIDTNIREVLEKNQSSNGEWLIRKKNGDLLEIELHISRCSAQGRPSTLCCIIKDLSEYRRYKALLQDTQEISQIGGWEYNLTYPRFEYSPEFSAILDIPDDQPITVKSLFNFCKKNHYFTLRKHLIQALNEGEAFDVSFKIKSAKGQAKWCRVTCNPIQLQNKITKLIGTIQDITPQKQLEVELETLSLVASKTQNAVLIVDHKNRVEWANESLIQLSGFSYPEVIGSTPQAFLGSEYEFQQVKAQLEKQQAFNAEVCNTKQNGQHYWAHMNVSPVLDEGGNLLKYIIILTNITERKQAENQLKHSEATVRSILESNDLAIWLVDESYRLETFNHMAYQLYKESYQVEFKEGANLLELFASIHKDYHILHKAFIERALQGESFTKIIQHTGEPNKYYEFTYNFVKGAPDSRKVSVFAKDVTVRVQSEQKLKHNLDLQNFITSISSNFVNTQTIWKLRKQIQDTMYRVGQFAKVDSSYLYVLSEDNTRMQLQGKWVQEGFKSTHSIAEYLDVNNLQWWIEKFKNEDVLCLPSLQQNPFMEKDKPHIPWELNIESHISVPIKVNNKMLGILGFDTISKSKQWDSDDVFLMKILAEFIGHAIERTRSSEKVIESEKLYRTIAKNFPNGTITLLDNHYRIVFTEGREFDNIPINAEHIIGKAMQEVVTPENKPLVTTKYKESFKGVSQHFQLQVHGNHYAMHTVPLVEQNGDIEKIMVVSQNISVQKKAEEKIKQSLHEKEILLKEIHHRVKNNMQVVSGLIMLQSNYILNPMYKNLFQESANRIRSMAMIHEKLYQSDTLSKIEFSNYIRDIIGYIKNAYCPPGILIRAELDLSPAYLDINMAVPCGLLINEILSNAYKHAFLGRDKGHIYIKFDKLGDLYTLILKDDGVGFEQEVSLKKSKTLGLTLINALSKQLKAEIEFDNHSGTEFRIQFKTAFKEG
ncbi:PAS domain S-box protein [Rapidithrix thailandica]|uniref:histidine kinase n=1 Tax=Rapidithrix thailandica TaxID=413964 RepID=A0AAW9RP13_9BACT